MNTSLLIITALAAAAITGLITTLILKNKHQQRVNEMEKDIANKDAELKSNARIAAEKENSQAQLLKNSEENYRQTLQTLKDSHEKSIAELKKNQEEQLKSVVAQMKAESQEILRKREEELTKGNRSSMDEILKPLKESIVTMEKAMKDNAESHLKNTTELSKQFEQAIKDIKKETSEVGQKADSLSEALTSKPKMQGCFGENQLESILNHEGLIRDLHFTKESSNEDRSRPDFVFHFKDGMDEKDLIVDSKVSLTAFVKYTNADNVEDKKDAMKEHLISIRKHIEELAKKEYSKKVKNPFVDYVIMFMPIDTAFRVALLEEPMLWQEAYKKGVLITTDQTIIPFLKIIQLTWNKFQHDTNIMEITKAAEDMIDRVGAFYDSYKDLGTKLTAVYKEYNSGIKKLQEDGKSITTSAKKVMKIGIKRSKGKEFLIPEKMIEIAEDE